MWLPGRASPEMAQTGSVTVDGAIALAPDHHLARTCSEVCIPTPRSSEAMARALVAGARRRRGRDGRATAMKRPEAAVAPRSTRFPTSASAPPSIAPQPEMALDRRREVARTSAPGARLTRRRAAVEECPSTEGVTVDRMSCTGSAPIAVDDAPPDQPHERLGDAPLPPACAAGRSESTWKCHTHYATGSTSGAATATDLEPFVDAGCLRRDGDSPPPHPRGHARLRTRRSLTVFIAARPRRTLSEGKFMRRSCGPMTLK